MLKGSHTPGPWRELSNGFTKPTIAGIPIETTVIESAANDTLIESPAAIICAIWQGRNRDRVAPLDERYANARLIAKAPELLDLLRNANVVLADIADDAGDVAFWNKGGDGYECNRAIRALLAEIDGGDHA